MFTNLDNGARTTLLDVARASIDAGLRGERLRLDGTAECSPELQATAATFVTLTLHGALRGCIGTLDAFQPLIADTAENAHGAAYRDPRFPAVTAQESEYLDIHISILGPAEAMVFASEQDLLSQLRPGIDGLILTEKGRRGTFLPAVGESVPDPIEFLGHLKIKAGLPPDYWSESIKVARYTTVSIP